MRAIVLLSTLLLTVLRGHSQGDVIFDNFGGGLVHNNRTASDVSTADGVVVQLYASGTGMDNTFAAVPNSIVQVGVLADGFYDGGVVRIPGSIISPGAGAFLEIRAWESAYGATFEDAICAANMGGRPAQRGISSPFMVPSTGNPLSSPPGNPVPLSDLAPSFSLLTGPGFPCPEPATILLGLVGGAGLWLVRKQNQ